MGPLECLIAANAHGTYCVPALSAHRPAARAVLAGAVWEAGTLGFLTAHCGSGDVIHAGTYFGDFLPALSHAIADDARIWAFEPSSINVRCASITVKLNDIANVVLTHAALGAETGEARLCVCEPGKRPSGGGSAIAATQHEGGQYEAVRVVALDDVVPADRRISIVQLDVERYEQQALAGALSTIRRWRPLLLLENLPADPTWFAQNVLSLGYESAGMVDLNHVLRPSGNPARIASPS